MADRREISLRKAALLQNLRKAYRDGQLVPGEMAPSVRDLARQYELSVGIVAQQMQVLVQEGVLHTVSGAGTFVGRAPSKNFQLFLFLLANSMWDNQVKAGFEEEVARRGCATLVMPPHRVADLLKTGALPSIDGVFVYGARPVDRLIEQLNEDRTSPLPVVNYVDREEDFSHTDRVVFDNFDGGRQATQHLQAAGHERIAYLGVHAPDDFIDTEWSVLRLEGWQVALNRSDSSIENLAFLPRKMAIHAVLESPQLLKEAAVKLLQTSNATAVVAANDAAARQLIEACRQAVANIKCDRCCRG